jgi:hypothetical protein
VYSVSSNILARETAQRTGHPSPYEHMQCNQPLNKACMGLQSSRPCAFSKALGESWTRAAQLRSSADSKAHAGAVRPVSLTSPCFCLLIAPGMLADSGSVHALWLASAFMLISLERPPREATGGNDLPFAYKRAAATLFNHMCRSWQMCSTCTVSGCGHVCSLPKERLICFPFIQYLPQNGACARCFLLTPCICVLVAVTG